jgi:SAM-dependent methyltransferase
LSASQRRDLFLATFAILALELAIIRWMSQQVRLFAYLNNVLLIAAFLGMGLGVGKRRPALLHWALPLLAVLCAVLGFSDRLGLTHLALPDQAIAMWGLATAPFLRSIAIVTALFLLVTAVFVCAGSIVGEIFAKSESLSAYAADLAGSLAGVVAMTIMSALQTPPPLWFAIGGLPLAWLSRRAIGWISLVATVALTWYSVGDAVFSPYYRIDLDRATRITGQPVRLSVNRDFHQYINDFSTDRINALTGETRENLRVAELVYRLPFLLSPRKGQALIVGAGTGNDAAAALRGGFQRVVAVEIDPRIVSIGRALHPEKPYDDSRVEVVVEDARAYFEQHRDERFDAIAFGLLDSHAVFSSMASLRLDNYVYTADSVRRAWGQLATPGVLSISFAAEDTEWISDRLFAIVRDATGVEPLVVRHGMQGGRFYIATKGMNLADVQRRYGITAVAPTALAETIRVPTDDWPFLYLKPGSVPYGYLTVLLMILLVALGGARWAFGATVFHRGRFDPVMFLMGAAFLLIETRGVTALSLLFGSTWIVNAAVFGGVLVIALGANALVRRWRFTDVRIAYAFLFAALTISYVIAPQALLELPMAVRGIVGSLVNALPIGFAGLAFSTLLRLSPQPEAALGSNLLGAVLGGCLEYVSMVVGLRALTLLALALYLGALFIIEQRRRANTAALA